VIYLAGLAAVIVFAFALDRSGVSRVAAGAIETSRNATDFLRDRAVSDDVKEKAMRQASLSLLRSFFSIGIRGMVAAGLSFLILVLFDLTGLASLDAVTRWLARWEVILSISLVVVAWLFIRRRK
jgi:hypothetical protein